jgi:glycosyltransferase involved in cell wall biosynthesis
MDAVMVSVIIPTYNRMEYILDAVESVLAQTFEDFEVLVVDDGSTDNTREVLASISSDRVFTFHKPNRGVASALNFGIERARGSYIARLDSDDMFLPEKLELQVKVLNEKPGVGLVYTQAYNTDAKGEITELYPEGHTPPGEPLRALRYSLFAPSQSIMFRRELLRETGLFDEGLRIAEDWDFFIRMAQNCRLYYIAKPLVKIRKHSEMLTGDKLESLEQTIIVLEKNRDVLSLGEGSGWLGDWYYKLGRRLFYECDYERARWAFRTAAGHDPALLKSWLFYLLSVLPPGLIARLKRSSPGEGGPR